MDGTGLGAADLFDAQHYARQRPDVPGAGMACWPHYTGHGWREGAWPHPLFDPAHYRAQTPHGDTEPFSHYLAEGWRAGLSPHPLFDPAHYAAQAGDTGMAPLAHYLRFGWRQGLSPHPLFDAPHYLHQRPDLCSATEPVEPLQHYLSHGWREGTRPHPLFDPAFYRAQVPDPAMPDLLHYLLHGEAEGLRPHPLFRPFYYKAVNAAHEGAEASPLLHYARVGEALGLPAAPGFRRARFISRHLWGVADPRPLRHPLAAVADDAPAAWPPAPRPPFAGAARPFVLALLGPGGEGRAAMLAGLGAQAPGKGVRPFAGGWVLAAADPAALAAKPLPRGLPPGTPTVLVAGDAYVAAADLHRLAFAAPAHPVVLDRAGNVAHAGYAVQDGLATPRGVGWDPANPDLAHVRDGLVTPGPVAAAPWADVLEACRAGGGAAAAFMRLGGRFLPAAQAVLPEAPRPGFPRASFGPLPYGGPATAERPRVLFIDSIVPRAGYDGGSSYVLQLLDMYGSFGFAPTLLPDAEIAAPPDVVQALAGRGVRVVQAPFAPSSEAYLQTTPDEYAVVVMSRICCGGRHMAFLRARWPAARLVFHPVDLHHLREIREAVLRKDARSFEAALRTEAEELRVAREADLTVVVSEHELSVLQEAGAGGRAVWIEPEHASPAPAPYVPEARSGVLFVGSFRHAPNLDAVEWLCGHAWPLVMSRRPDIPLLVAGSDMPEGLHRHASGSVSMLGHVPDLQGLLDGVRLTVAPLRYGAGVKLKLLSSLGAGVPAVCTPIAAEGTGFRPGEGVVLAESAEAFAEAVVALYDDAARLRRLSEAGAAAMAGRFSPASVRARYRAALGWAPGA